MSKKKAKEQGFTHQALLYGVPIYFNINTNEVKGVNWFQDLMLEFSIWWNFTFCESYGFDITLIEEL